MKLSEMILLVFIASFCIVIFPLNLSADQSIKVQDDFGGGIKSNIYVSLSNKDEAKGITDDSGTISIDSPCHTGEQIKACPVNPLYYEGLADCSPNQKPLIVIVTKKAFAINLEWNAKEYETNERFGDAAIVYSEIAARYQKIEPEKANIAKKKVYEMFAEAIETPNDIKVLNYDKKQGMKVLTPEFVDYLKEYQKQKSIPVTGAIDFNTLSTQSDVSIGAVLSNKMYY